MADAVSSISKQNAQYHGYGLHYPQGLSAVKYLYGPNGTYKKYSKLENVHAYYSGWGGGTYNNHGPTGVDENGKNALIAYANGTRATATPDANAHVLDHVAKDSSHSFASPYPASFHEHNGRGASSP